MSRFLLPRRFQRLLIAVACLSLPVLAQSPIAVVDNTTLTPTPGVGHDYIDGLSETVNPANGSVTVKIAAQMPKDRGLNFPVYAYLYSTSGYYQWTPDFIAGGTSLGYTRLLNEINALPSYSQTGGSILTGQTQNIHGNGAPGTLSNTNLSFSSGASHDCTYNTNYIYFDAAGGTHPLGIQYMAPTYATEANCGYFSVSDGGFLSGGDGTIFASLDPSSTTGDAYVYDLHGDQLNQDYKIEDTNGNYLNASGRQYSGSYGGTLGIAPNSLTLAGSNGSYGITYPTYSTQSPSNPFKPDAAGMASNIAQCPTSFGTLTGSYSGNTVVTLPNGENYTISYDPNYQLVDEITYPNGATVSYTWANNTKSDSVSYGQSGTDACSYTFDMPAVQSRSVSYDGVTTALKQTFKYTTTWDTTKSYPIWTQKTTTVTTTDLTRSGSPAFKTIYTYLPGVAYTAPWGPISTGSYIPVESSISYQDTAGNVLRTVTKVWSGQNYNLITAECTTLPNGKTSGVFYQYQQPTTLVTDVAEYDSGLVTTPCQQPSTSPTRETVTTYKSFAATPINTIIQDRPQSVIVYHGNRIADSETDYLYDGSVPVPVTPAPSGHDNTHYGVGMTPARGNPTTITRKCFSGSTNCTNSVTTYTYDITGQVVTEVDACGNATCSDVAGSSHTTTYSYGDNYTTINGSPTQNTNAYVTKITRPQNGSTAHITQYQYDFDSGRLHMMTDENSQATTYCYWTGGCSGSAFDPFYRLTGITYPDGGKTTVAYADTGSTPSVTVSRSTTGSNLQTTATVYDAMWRPTMVENVHDPAGMDITQTGYDGMGHIMTVTNPYRSTSDTTYGVTTFTYDSLGRTLLQQQPDGSSLQWCYDGVKTVQTNCGKTNLSSKSSYTWVDQYDEVGNHRQQVSDGLGRLVAVMEPNSSNTPAFETDYGYDSHNNLVQVDQYGGAVGNAGDRARSFSYDSLSRLLTATNPETGTIGYSYDADSNVVTKTDARSIVTTYGYDVLNRMTSKTYSDGSPGVTYNYDQTSSWAGALSNTIGRLSEAITGLTAGMWADRLYSYDPMGRVSAIPEAFPSEAGNAGHTTSFTYDAAGEVSSITYPDGRVIAESWDGGGHLSQVADGSLSGYSYLTTSSGYWPNGSPEAIFHGDGVADGYRLNNRLQTIGIGPVHIGADAPGTYTGNNVLSGKVYCYGPAATAAQTAALPCPSLGSQNNGNVLQILDRLISNNSQAASYDTLNRIAGFTNGTGSMMQTYTIDPWGNMTMAGTASSGLSFAGASNNRDTSGTLGYDASGNVTSANNGISTATYTYDGESRALTAIGGSVSYVYDGEGNRVRKNAGGSFTEYMQYGGQTLAEKNADGSWSDYIYANGQRMVRADSYDIHIHLSGTNCSNCGMNPNMAAGTTSLTAANGYVVRSGDLLTWRQFQDGSALGGLYLWFTDGTSGLTATDTDGQPIDADTTENTWHVRTVSLNQFVGKTIELIDPFNAANAPAGTWDIYYGDIVLASTDGSFIPVYNRSMMTLAVATNPTVANFQAVTEKANTKVPLTTATYYHGDQVGSESMLTAATGWPVSSNIYYPYGQGPLPGTNHYLFTGKERDTESGNDYFGARYYASSTGRWMSPDWSARPTSVPYASLPYPQSLNLYSYVQNNPLSRTDSDGHCWAVISWWQHACNAQDGNGWKSNAELTATVTTTQGPVTPLLDQAQSPQDAEKVQQFNFAVNMALLGMAGGDEEEPLDAELLSVGGAASESETAATAGTATPTINGVPQPAPGGQIVVGPNGTAVPIPAGYVAEAAANGNGIVYRPSGSTGNANTIRVMGPDAQGRYPQGYVVTYNSSGQPTVPPTQNPGTRAQTHTLF